MNSSPNPLLSMFYCYSIFYLPFKALQKLKDTLHARGNNSIRSLSKIFKPFDSYDGNRKINRDEFYLGLQDLGLKFTIPEIDVISVISLQINLFQVANEIF